MVLIHAALAAQLEETIPLAWEVMFSSLDHATLLSLLGALAKLCKSCCTHASNNDLWRAMCGARGWLPHLEQTTFSTVVAEHHSRTKKEKKRGVGALILAQKLSAWYSFKDLYRVCNAWRCDVCRVDGRGAPYVAVLSNKRLCFHCIKKTGNPESANVITKPQAVKYFQMTPTQLNSIPHAKATLAMSNGPGSKFLIAKCRLQRAPSLWSTLGPPFVGHCWREATRAQIDYRETTHTQRTYYYVNSGGSNWCYPEVDCRLAAEARYRDHPGGWQAKVVAGKNWNHGPAFVRPQEYTALALANQVIKLGFAPPPGDSDVLVDQSVIPPCAKLVNGFAPPEMCTGDCRFEWISTFYPCGRGGWEKHRQGCDGEPYE